MWRVGGSIVLFMLEIESKNRLLLFAVECLCIKNLKHFFIVVELKNCCMRLFVYRCDLLSAICN